MGTTLRHLVGSLLRVNINLYNDSDLVCSPVYTGVEIAIIHKHSHSFRESRLRRDPKCRFPWLHCRLEGKTINKLRGVQGTNSPDNTFLPLFSLAVSKIVFRSGSPSGGLCVLDCLYHVQFLLLWKKCLVCTVHFRGAVYVTLLMSEKCSWLFVFGQRYFFHWPLQVPTE